MWNTTFLAERRIRLVTASLKSAKRSLASSILEFKLDELRKEVSSIHGKIFPHSVMSTQQISMIFKKLYILFFVFVCFNKYYCFLKKKKKKKGIFIPYWLCLLEFQSLWSQAIITEVKAIWWWYSGYVIYYKQSNSLE